MILFITIHILVGVALFTGLFCIHMVFAPMFAEQDREFRRQEAEFRQQKAEFAKYRRGK